MGAARAMWKAVLAVGQARVGVKFYAALSDRDVHFRLLHDQDQVPVKQRLVSSRSGEPVPGDEVVHAAAVGSGRFVLLHPQERDPLEPPASRLVTVQAFMPAAHLSHQWYVRPYFLGPDDGADLEYAALAQALRDTGMAGIALWVMRRKRQRGALLVQRGGLTLITLQPAELVVPVTDLEIEPAGRAPTEPERRMARQLVDALSGSFEHEAYRDEYRQRVLELVEAKSHGLPPPKGDSEAPVVGDEPLVRMLEASLRHVRQQPAREDRDGQAN